MPRSNDDYSDDRFEDATPTSPQRPTTGPSNGGPPEAIRYASDDSGVDGLGAEAQVLRTTTTVGRPAVRPAAHHPRPLLRGTEDDPLSASHNPSVLANQSAVPAADTSGAITIESSLLAETEEAVARGARARSTEALARLRHEQCDPSRGGRSSHRHERNSDDDRRDDRHHRYDSRDAGHHRSRSEGDGRDLGRRAEYASPSPPGARRPRSSSRSRSRQAGTTSLPPSTSFVTVHTPPSKRHGRFVEHSATASYCDYDSATGDRSAAYIEAAPADHRSDRHTGQRAHDGWAASERREGDVRAEEERMERRRRREERREERARSSSRDRHRDPQRNLTEMLPEREEACDSVRDGAERVEDRPRGRGAGPWASIQEHEKEAWVMRVDEELAAAVADARRALHQSSAAVQAVHGLYDNFGLQLPDALGTHTTSTSAGAKTEGNKPADTQAQGLVKSHVQKQPPSVAAADASGLLSDVAQSCHETARSAVATVKALTERDDALIQRSDERMKAMMEAFEKTTDNLFDDLTGHVRATLSTFADSIDRVEKTQQDVAEKMAQCERAVAAVRGTVQEELTRRDAALRDDVTAAFRREMEKALADSERRVIRRAEELATTRWQADAAQAAKTAAADVAETARVEAVSEARRLVQDSAADSRRFCEQTVAATEREVRQQAEDTARRLVEEGAAKVHRDVTPEIKATATQAAVQAAESAVAKATASLVPPPQITTPVAATSGPCDGCVKVQRELVQLQTNTHAVEAKCAQMSRAMTEQEQQRDRDAAAKDAVLTRELERRDAAIAERTKAAAAATETAVQEDLRALRTDVEDVRSRVSAVAQQADRAAANSRVEAPSTDRLISRQEHEELQLRHERRVKDETDRRVDEALLRVRTTVEDRLTETDRKTAAAAERDAKDRRERDVDAARARDRDHAAVSERLDAMGAEMGRQHGILRDQVEALSAVTSRVQSAVATPQPSFILPPQPRVDPTPVAAPVSSPRTLTPEMTTSVSGMIQEALEAQHAGLKSTVKKAARQEVARELDDIKESVVAEAVAAAKVAAKETAQSTAKAPQFGRLCRTTSSDSDSGSSDTAKPRQRRKTKGPDASSLTAQIVADLKRQVVSLCEVSEEHHTILESVDRAAKKSARAQKDNAQRIDELSRLMLSDGAAGGAAAIPSRRASSSSRTSAAALAVNQGSTGGGRYSNRRLGDRRVDRDGILESNPALEAALEFMARQSDRCVGRRALMQWLGMVRAKRARAEAKADAKAIAADAVRCGASVKPASTAATDTSIARDKEAKAKEAQAVRELAERLDDVEAELVGMQEDLRGSAFFRKDVAAEGQSRIAALRDACGAALWPQTDIDRLVRRVQTQVARGALTVSSTSLCKDTAAGGPSPGGARHHATAAQVQALHFYPSGVPGPRRGSEPPSARGSVGGGEPYRSRSADMAGSSRVVRPRPSAALSNASSTSTAAFRQRQHGVTASVFETSRSARTSPTRASHDLSDLAADGDRPAHHRLSATRPAARVHGASAAASSAPSHGTTAARVPATESVDDSPYADTTLLLAPEFDEATAHSLLTGERAEAAVHAVRAIGDLRHALEKTRGRRGTTTGSKPCTVNSRAGSASRSGSISGGRTSQLSSGPLTSTAGPSFSTTHGSRFCHCCAGRRHDGSDELPAAARGGASAQRATKSSAARGGCDGGSCAAVDGASAGMYLELDDDCRTRFALVALALAAVQRWVFAVEASALAVSDTTTAP